MFKTANRYDSVEDIAKNPTNCKAVPIKSIFARFKKKRSQGNSYVASNENLIHGIKCSEKLKNFYFVDNREQLMFPMKELGLPKKKK